MVGNQPAPPLDISHFDTVVAVMDSQALTLYVSIQITMD